MDPPAEFEALLTSDMSVRESAVVIIETSRAHIRAGVGLYELLKTPSMVRACSIFCLVYVGLKFAMKELLARAGIRKGRDAQPMAASSRAGSLISTRNRSINDYVVGKQLNDLLAAGEDLEIVWPFANGEVSDWVAAEALWYETALFISSV
jgi:actin-related protein 9